MWIAGVDGCPAGWFAVIANVSRAGRVTTEKHLVCKRITELMVGSPSPRVIAIDIPIGLLDGYELGGRLCDRQARQLLNRMSGIRRGSCVFPAPPRPVVSLDDYSTVRSNNNGHGISRQAWNIRLKIRELDSMMTPDLQDQVVEVHPEVSFAVMNNEVPMALRKSRTPGIKERIAVLERKSGFSSLETELALSTFRRKEVGRSDVVDAYAALWTAWRVSRGKERRIPSMPERDARGLRMEIVA